jgi:sigma-B regulation protein RsbU (phosphoserine phosphatase)
MLVGGQVTGIHILQNIDEENAFDESHVRFLETLAASMSVALENARLWEQEHLYRRALEREFEIGRKIQAGFLPDILPRLPGWDIAASLISAREVAGDFYDVFKMADGKIGLVIADVCDKGLGAALFMILFRSLIRAASNVEFLAPAGPAGGSSAARLKKAISLTNNYIAETHGHTGMFATVFFGILDPRTGALAYVNGGHLPPLLVNAQGVKATLERTGRAVGATPDADFAAGETALEPGDTLFAYTDGLTEAASPAGEAISVQELAPLVAGGRALSEQLALILKQIESFSPGARPNDDITLLAVRRDRAA